MTRNYEKKTTSEIKKALVSKFGKGCGWSVKKGRGTASHWVSIAWTDGPPSKVVRSFTGAFNDSANDDLMTDLWCGSQYTNEHRRISPGAFGWAVRHVCDRFGLPYPKVLSTTESAWIPDGFNALVSENGHHVYDRISDHAHRLLEETDFRKVDPEELKYHFVEGSAVTKPGNYGWTEYELYMGCPKPTKPAEVAAADDYLREEVANDFQI